jgi:TRAP-type mannitol/chloroaromatic compound transport system permease small subunit
MTPRRKIDSSIFFDGCWMFLAVVFLAALIMGAFSLAYAQHVQNPIYYLGDRGCAYSSRFLLPC